MNKVAPSQSDNGLRKERRGSVAKSKLAYSSEKGLRPALPSNKVAVDAPETAPSAETDFDYTRYMLRRFRANLFAILPPRMQQARPLGSACLCRYSANSSPQATAVVQWLSALGLQLGLAQRGVVKGAKTYFCFAVLFTVISRRMSLTVTTCIDTHNGRLGVPQIIVFANRPGESEFYLNQNLERLLLDHEISFKESPFPKR